MNPIIEKIQQKEEKRRKIMKKLEKCNREISVLVALQQHEAQQKMRKFFEELEKC